MTEPKSQPLNQRQLEDLMNRVRRMVQTSGCSNAVALELYQLLELDVYLAMFANDCDKTAKALIEDAAVRAERIRGIGEKRIAFAKPSLIGRIRDALRKQKAPAARPESEEPYATPGVIQEARPRIVRVKDPKD